MKIGIAKLTAVVDTQGMAAPVGSRNAAKADSEKHTSFLYVKCQPGEKAAWVKAGQTVGLSEWVRATLNAAVESKSK